MFVLSKQSALAAMSTSLFVLLWSSGAIFSKWGLAHASPFAFLLLRFVIALIGLMLATRLEAPIWVLFLFAALAGLEPSMMAMTIRAATI